MDVTIQIKLAGQMLASIDPLFSEFPLYLVSRDPSDRNYFTIPLMEDERHVLAWTSPNLSEQLQPYLVASRRWKGEGGAILLNVESHSDKLQSRLFEVVIHEAAHLADFRLGGCGHDPCWLRALSHLSYRAETWLSRLGRTLNQSQLANLSSYGYSLSMGGYRNALRSELGQTSRPLLAILRSTAPEEFRRQITSDTPRILAASVNKNAMPVGSRFGVAAARLPPGYFETSPRSAEDPLDPFGQLDRMDDPW